MSNSPDTKAYDSFSADYDRFVNWEGRLAHEMPFIRRLKGGAGEGDADRPLRVLDAACGTVMHAIALAKEGYVAAGADLSEGMVAAARRNAADAGVEVDFEAAGFGELKAAFSAGRHFPFDALLCMGNSLPHLLTPPELATALDDFAACLGSGGVLLIQNRNFDAVMAVRERWMEPQAHSEGGREWLFLRFYDYDADGLITFKIVTLQRGAGEGWQQQVSSTRLKPLRQAELIDALSAAGYGQIECYGSMAWEIFDPKKSGNLIVTARVG
jgi:glycine/sarcosine N-methyltransferase